MPLSAQREIDQGGVHALALDRLQLAARLSMVVVVAQTHGCPHVVVLHLV